MSESNWNFQFGKRISGLLASVMGSKGRTFADSGVVLSQVFIRFIENITLGISKANGDSDLVDLKLVTVCRCL